MELILGTVAVGLAVAMLAWSGADMFGRMFDALEADLRDKFRRLRLPTNNLRTVLLAWLTFSASAYLTLWLILDLPLIGLCVLSVFVCLPWYLVRRMAEKRREQIEDQLADAMVSLASAIRAGLSLAQALEILSTQTPRPISQEFTQLVGEYQLGKPMEQCLSETKERLRSENFALFAAAIQASRQSGGRLNETVERIALSVRELQRLERKIQSETAEARTSAVYMALSPLLILAIYYVAVDPVSTSRLFTTLWGQVLLSMALLLNVIAYLWARVILSPSI